MTHELKCWAPYYDDIVSGRKKFELRKNDRDFKVGDNIHLREYLPQSEIYSGEECYLNIIYILEGFKGIEDGYVVLGVELQKTMGKKHTIWENFEF